MPLQQRFATWRRKQLSRVLNQIEKWSFFRGTLEVKRWIK
jgi:hypothetical protein